MNANMDRWVSAAMALKATLNVANDAVAKLRADINGLTKDEIAAALKDLQEQVLDQNAQIAAFDSISSTPLVRKRDASASSSSRRKRRSE